MINLKKNKIFMKKKESPLYVNLAYESEMNRLAQNENPYGASNLAKEAVLENINKMSLYPDVILMELKEKLAKKHGVSPQEIIVSNGSGAIIDHLVNCMPHNGENMIVPELTFVAYKLCAAIYRKECRLVPMENYSINLHKIADNCDKKTHLVFLSNPNNPTGTIFSHDEIVEFLDRISSKTLVVLDEAYKEYVTDVSFPRSIELYNKYPNIIILHSFSKIYGLAGLRIGYGIARTSVIEELEKNRLPFMVGTLANIAALAALDDMEHVSESARKNAKGREILFQELSGMGYNVIPSQGNFLFISFATTEDRNKMYDTLLANKIVVRKMESFGDNRALRISLGRTAANIRMLDCLKIK
ncbi:MAG: histidinol-phosphate transaminase [Bacteroidetes bacterium CG2_30_33_31]|nr:MAG: histidinol-phosphate transaminase [Bacteroidetes bacterium CG2_30_33_31]